MQGTMMNYPLTLTSLLERAEKLFGDVEIVSRRPDRTLARSNYAEFTRRARALAEGLTRAGLRRGDRVATLMWNSGTHLEAYFGIPAAGGVLHTLNLRLHADELAYIANHAEDRFLIVDDVLLPILEKFRDKVKFERIWVAPFSGQPVPQGYDSYEDLIASARGGSRLPALQEDEAGAMCFTSGTTGQPKGVLYSHRALVLHSMAECMADSFAFSQRDTTLCVSSMFHANGWGYPFSAVMVGSKLVFPGPNVEPEGLLDLMAQEGVTLTNGVPTIWIGILDVLEKNPGRWKLRPGLRAAGAGTAVPESVIRRLDAQGIRLIHLWGMTETTPLATASTLCGSMEEYSDDEKYAVRATQGRPVPLLDMRAMAGGNEVPWDAKTIGELQVRGPWVAGSYFNYPESKNRWTPDGWFCTGDMVTIDPLGYIRITDRSKDLIKSGGEWISSVDVENALMGHPGVREAAVIGVPHPKWQERPVAVVVCRDGCAPREEELRQFLATKFAKWQLPDAFVFTDAIPKTSVGKFLKSQLREQYRDWKWT